MMFQSLFTSTLLIAVLQLGAVDSMHLYKQSHDVQPSLPSRRSIYNPTITSPVKGTVWKVGDHAEVTWDPQSLPQEYRRQKSQVVLGWIEPGSSNEHLDLDHPLANGFELSTGSVGFTVPKVTPKQNYIVVLFGDSGNRSPEFSIST